MLRRYILAVIASTMLGISAQAAAGVVVRLVSTSGALSGEVTATVVNESGGEASFTLLDNGEAPDVFEGDNQYSASGMLDGTDATVFITVDGEKTEGGEITWSDDTTPRDLIITMGDGLITIETGMAIPGGEAPIGGEAINGPPPEGGPSTEPTPASTPGRTPGVRFPKSGGSATDDTTLYLLGGALVLVLAITAFLWLRAPSADQSGSRTSRHYTLQPEPGLLGSVTPSLSDGLSTWQVEPAEQEAFGSLLLQSIAQHHRVLVVAADETTLPPVAGGPIYRAQAGSAVAVADAAISLMEQPGLPLAVLVWKAEIEQALLSDYATVLTPDVGVVALICTITGEAQAMDVTISATEQGWRVQRGDTGVVISMTEWGVRVSPAPSASTQA
jgi:hypothetical protein